MLEKVQKRATKLIPKLKNMVGLYIDRLKLLKLPTLHYKQVRENMIEMYKILPGKYDTAVTSRVTREHSYISRGNDLRSEKIRPKYDLRKHFFTNTVVNIWNTLPNDVVSCDTVKKFKSYFIYSGNIKILCMIIKLKFTEPEVEVHITRTSYIKYQYFVSFVFVMRALEALACARHSSTSTS